MFWYLQNTKDDFTFPSLDNLIFESWKSEFKFHFPEHKESIKPIPAEKKRKLYFIIFRNWCCLVFFPKNSTSQNLPPYFKEKVLIKFSFLVSCSVDYEERVCLWWKRVIKIIVINKVLRGLAFNFFFGMDCFQEPLRTKYGLKHHYQALNTFQTHICLYNFLKKTGNLSWWQFWTLFHF